MARTKKLGELIASAEDIGDLLGIGRDMVLKHVRENDMPKLSNGRYPVRECIRWYVERIKSSATDIKDERRKLTRAQRLRTELDIERRRGELIDVNKYREDLGAVASAFSKLDNQAPRIGAELGLKRADIRRLADILKQFREQAARDILAKAGAIRCGDDPAATAKPKRRAVGRRKPAATGRRTRAGAVVN